MSQRNPTLKTLNLDVELELKPLHSLLCFCGLVGGWVWVIWDTVWRLVTPMRARLQVLYSCIHLLHTDFSDPHPFLTSPNPHTLTHTLPHRSVNGSLDAVSLLRPVDVTHSHSLTHTRTHTDPPEMEADMRWGETARVVDMYRAALLEPNAVKDKPKAVKKKASKKKLSKVCITSHRANSRPSPSPTCPPSPLGPVPPPPPACE
jgi:hypothetical protein